MGLDDLLTMLERRRTDTPDTSCNLLEVSAKPAPIGACTHDTPGTPQKDSWGDDVRKAGMCAMAATTSRWWRFHYLDGAQKEAAYCPSVTRVEALAGEPDAIAAEPFEPICRRPDEPLRANDETAIRAWLRHIKETDEGIVSNVMKQCHTDADARSYFIERARKL